MPIDLDALCDDLTAERDDLIALASGRAGDWWTELTPSEGWTVLDQLTHLAHFDDEATMSMSDPVEFRRRVASMRSVQSFVDDIAERHRSLTGGEALAWLRRSNGALVEAAKQLGPDRRVPWFGPSMTVASSLTARLMETWAHGQDVADALDVVREPTRRIGHVAFIGVRALAYSFRVNDLPVPEAPIRVELTAPDGGVVAYGPADAPEKVVGSMLDFCLLVTQRRHRADTSLVAQGAIAVRWLEIAQAFAGPPGPGRKRRS